MSSTALFEFIIHVSWFNELIDVGQLSQALFTTQYLHGHVLVHTGKSTTLLRICKGRVGRKIKSQDHDNLISLMVHPVHSGWPIMGPVFDPLEFA